jgi:hypothetical protein
VKPTLAQQYGERFAQAFEAHHAAAKIIQDFADRHSLYIDDPAHPWDGEGPRWMVQNPTPHTLCRTGDTLFCMECEESVHAPVPPPRPLTPQEASLSRFD